MAGLMAFLPNFRGTDKEELTRRGLADLLEPGVRTLMRDATGPDDSHGVLVTFDNPANPHSVTPQSVDLKTQKWMPAPPDGELAAGRYWLGYVKEARPRPEDLQRRELFDGEPVVLADNLAWVIPISHYMPKLYTRDMAGKVVTVPQDRHKWFVEWSNILFEHFMSDGFRALLDEQHVVNIPGGFQYATLAISKNYRVNQDVVDLLGLVGPDEAMHVAFVATSLTSTRRAIAQKKSTEALSQPAGVV